MAYTPGIPNSTDVISQSQSQIRTNFVELNSQFAIDHVAFNAGSDNGKHKKSTYIEQASDPNPSPNECALYSKESSSVTELFFQRENSGSVIQMTIGDPIAASTGQTFLPGGIILKWSSSTITSNNQLFNFSTPFPNNCFGVVAINSGSGSNTSYFSISAKSSSGFNLLQNGGSFPLNFFYLAVGN